MSVQDKFAALNEQLQQGIIGQQGLVERLLIALLADGHLLVEGGTGSGQNTAIKLLGDTIEGSFPSHSIHPGSSAR